MSYLQIAIYSTIKFNEEISSIKRADTIIFMVSAFFMFLF